MSEWLSDAARIQEELPAAGAFLSEEDDGSAFTVLCAKEANALILILTGPSGQ